MMHPAAPRYLTVAPLPPLLIAQEHRHRPALVGIGAPQPMLGIRPRRTQHRIAPRASAHLGYHCVDYLLALGIAPHRLHAMEAVAQPVDLPIVIDDHRWKGPLVGSGQYRQILLHRLLMQTGPHLGAAVG